DLQRECAHLGQFNSVMSLLVGRRTLPGANHYNAYRGSGQVVGGGDLTAYCCVAANLGIRIENAEENRDNQKNKKIKRFHLNVNLSSIYRRSLRPFRRQY